MPKFMLILVNDPNVYPNSSPEEMQRIFEKYRAWSDKMRSQDRVVTSDKLQEEGGKILTARDGRMSVVDGPYSEAKEVVGGYFMIRAKDYDEAVALCSDCPHLQFGRLEVRQVDAMGCGES